MNGIRCRASVIRYAYPIAACLIYRDGRGTCAGAPLIRRARSRGTQRQTAALTNAGVAAKIDGWYRILGDYDCITFSAACIRDACDVSARLCNRDLRRGHASAPYRIRYAGAQYATEAATICGIIA